MSTTKQKRPKLPGEILQKEFLRPMGITQTALAKHLNWSYAKTNEIVNGKRRITPEIALSLADALETMPDLWLDLQKNLDIWRAKQKHKAFKPLTADE